MGADAWLAKMERELKELGARAPAELDAADAYRTLVILARLRQAPTTRDFSVPGAVDLIASRCQLPRPEQILEAFEAACDSGEEPQGVVLASLLDVDDLVGVLSLLGRNGEGTDVARRAAALASLFPEALLDLVEFAEMRMSTLSRDALAWTLWETVAEAPAELLVSSLPRGTEAVPLADHARLALARLRKETDEMVSLDEAALSGRSAAFVLPPNLFARAAAASADTDETPVHDAKGRRVGACAVDAGGARTVLLRLPKGVPEPKRVTASAGGRTVELTFECDGRDLHVVLAGAESLSSHGPIEVRFSSG